MNENLKAGQLLINEYLAQYPFESSEAKKEATQILNIGLQSLGFADNTDFSEQMVLARGSEDSGILDSIRYVLLDEPALDLFVELRKQDVIPDTCYIHYPTFNYLLTVHKETIEDVIDFQYCQANNIKVLACYTKRIPNQEPKPICAGTGMIFFTYVGKNKLTGKQIPLVFFKALAGEGVTQEGNDLYYLGKKVAGYVSTMSDDVMRTGGYLTYNFDKSIFADSYKTNDLSIQIGTLGREITTQINFSGFTKEEQAIWDNRIGTNREWLL